MCFSIPALNSSPAAARNQVFTASSTSLSPVSDPLCWLCGGWDRTSRSCWVGRGAVVQMTRTRKLCTARRSFLSNPRRLSAHLVLLTLEFPSAVSWYSWLYGCQPKPSKADHCATICCYTSLYSYFIVAHAACYGSQIFKFFTILCLGPIIHTRKSILQISSLTFYSHFDICQSYLIRSLKLAVGGVII